MLPKKLTLMIQGTTSDAGKSTLVCALGRALKNKGVSVAPFKSQNMALNSAVTEDGGEIGRAQALQAQACGLKPHTDFNPVLLKPTSDIGCQVIINGKAVDLSQPTQKNSSGNMKAREYHNYKPTAMKAVLAAHTRLSEQYDWVVVEGAGSPAEINLRDRDIANMGFAEAVDCPVIIIADIDRGGVFAHLVGTLDCLSESEQNRVIGFVINRFRGDISLLQPGLDWLEEKTGKPVLAVLPYLMGLHLDSEDSVSLSDSIDSDSSDSQKLKVVVPIYPRVSNHTDLDPLAAHPQVDLQLVGPSISAAANLQIPIPAADLVILPGSKNTRADLDWLKKQGWLPYLQQHLRYGGKILGICGGLQMLGKHIHDPLGLEGLAGSSEGFGWLDIETELLADKTLKNVSGQLTLPNQVACDIQGYEIHAGLSINSANASNSSNNHQSIIKTEDQHICGLLSSDQQIMASYWHGLMDTPEALQAILRWAGNANQANDFRQVDYQQLREQSIEALAASVEQQFDWHKLSLALDSFSKS